MSVGKDELSVEHELLVTLCELHRKSFAIFPVIHAAIRGLRLVKDAQERGVCDEHGADEHTMGLRLNTSVLKDHIIIKQFIQVTPMCSGVLLRE
jgi:hypothetical protein